MTDEALASMNAHGVRDLSGDSNMAIRTSFHGSIGRNSETKTVGDTTVTKFSVANNSGYGDKKKTSWVDCDIWGARGEKLSMYLTKGQSVLVYGEMDLNVYQGKDGTTKASFKCRVTDIELLGSKKDSEKSDESPSYAHQAPKSNYANDGVDFDDSIPF